MPLLTAGPKNESGIRTTAMQPGTAQPGCLRICLGDTGTLLVPPIPITQLAAHTPTRAGSLCWVTAESFWGLWVGLARQ